LSTVFHRASVPGGWKALADWYRIAALTVPESALARQWNGTRKPDLSPAAGVSMTDYRPRNHDLLYLGRERENLGWNGVAIFGVIGFAMMLLVAAYLTDSYNPASTGFSAAIPARASRATAVAQQPVTVPSAATPSISQLVVPRSGS
jgi:hypothetical protein